MDRGTKLLLFAIPILIVVGVVGSLAIARTDLPAVPTANGFNPRPATDFQLELFSGKKVRLSDFRGKKPVIVNFWASWCPPCREEAPVLARVSKSFAAEAKFLGVVINDDPANAKLFLKEFGITYDNGMDTGNIGGEYGITGIPETFWIDKQGQIVDHWIGAIEEDELTARTRRLISL